MVKIMKLNLLLYLFSFILSYSLAHAGIEITGNHPVQVQGTVTKKDNFEVSDGTGTGNWYTTLELMQAGSDVVYQVEAKVHVLSTNRNFMVTLKNNVILMNIGNNLSFLPAEVLFSTFEGESKILRPQEPQNFTNPEAPEGSDSEGDYTLKISAVPPSGNNKDIGGVYSGEIELLFETSASE